MNTKDDLDEHAAAISALISASLAGGTPKPQVIAAAAQAGLDIAVGALRDFHRIADALVAIAHKDDGPFRGVDMKSQRRG